METSELETMVTKKASEIVESKLAAQKKEDQKPDSYTVDEFVKHQDNCSDPDCPACVGVRKAEISGKIKNLKKQVSQIEQNRQETKATKQ